MVEDAVPHTKKNKYIYIINVSLVSSLICAFLHHLVVTEARQPN